MHAMPQKTSFYPVQSPRFERAEYVMALLKKHIGPVAVLILLLIFSAPLTAPGQEEDLLEDHPDAYLDKQRPAVNFPHEFHMGEFNCLQCHHDYDEDGKNVLDENLLKEDNKEILCGSCHNAGTDIDLKKAFHHNCIGCHRDSSKSGDPTGPELCGECHVKQ